MDYLSQSLSHRVQFGKVDKKIRAKGIIQCYLYRCSPIKGIAVKATKGLSCWNHNLTARMRAFTRVDLLAGTLTLGMLLALSFKALCGTQLHNHATVCLNNLRRLSLAWLLYVDDNSGRMVGNLDGGGVQTLSNSNKTWVLGWLDYNGGQPGAANTNTLYLTRYSPLASYTGRSAEVFKCPSDDSLSRGTTGSPRVRSYSMNSYLGLSRAYTANYRLFGKLDELSRPTPSRAFVFIDERPDSINDGVFQVDMTGYDPYNPNAWIMVDYPGMYHDRAATISFADGHVESKRWTDPRTTPRERFGQQITLNVPSSNNPDVLWLMERTTTKIVNQ